MTTYAEQVRPYINFESKDEMDKHFNMFRKKHRFDITEKENKVLFTLNGYAMKFPGACKIETEKLAKAAGVSVTTVKNAIRKAVNFNMLKRFKTRKQNGSRQGVTVYQFQRFLPENCPLKNDYSQNNEKPCESKEKELKFEPYALTLLLPSLKKSFKDTNITDMPEKNKSLKIGLLNKIPQVIAKAIGPFMDDAKEIYEMVGTIFNAKSKVDKSIKFEAYEDTYYKAIVSVFESQKRAARNERKNKPFNVFAVMYKAILETTKRIVCPELPVKSAEQPKVPVKPNARIEQVPHFMIDAATDPIEKARLIEQNELAKKQHSVRNGKEAVPSWFVPVSERKNVVEAPVRIQNEPEIDFEAERIKMLQKLGYSQEEIVGGFKNA